MKDEFKDTIPMKEKYFENEYTRIWIEDGILFSDYKPGLQITTEIAELCVEERLKISGGNDFPLFADVRNAMNIKKEAREYLSSPRGIKGISAGAFLIGTHIEKLLGNAFILIDRPPIPTKLFTDETRALDWLRQYKYMRINHYKNFN